MRDGLRLRDLTWRDLRALIRYPRPGSALEQSRDPDAGVTSEAMFLRDIAYFLQCYAWNGKPPAPEPVLLTAAEREAAKAAKKPGADLLPADEMLARLGIRRPDPEEVEHG